MSTVPKSLISHQEYLERERRSETRSEYYCGEIRPVPGSNWAHGLIKCNFAGEVGNRLKGGPCQVVTSDLRVKVDASGLYTYPDITVICGSPQFEDEVFDTLLNPRVIVEVLSDSTESYDRGAKFGNYRQVPSLQEYVLVAQDRPLVERYVRQADATWVLTEFRDLSQTFAFSAIAVQVPLAEIYRGVTFADTAARDQRRINGEEE